MIITNYDEWRKLQHIQNRPEQYVHISELAAANKAIVTLSGMIDLILDSDMAMREEDEGETSDELEMARKCLEFHAPAIEKARGG